MTLRRLPVIELLDHAAARRLGAEWDELLGDSSVTTPFLTWAWVGAWLDTIGADADLAVVVARDADHGDLAGIAPFHIVRTRRGGVPVRELRMIGSGRTAADHLDLIVRTSAGTDVAEALWRATNENRSWDLVDLDGVLSDGHLSRLVLQRTGDQPERIPAPYLPLTQDWEGVQARFGRSHRQNIGRYGRKLRSDADAPVSERMVIDPADLDRSLDRLIEMHQAIRTSKGDPGVFGDPESTRFLRTVAHRMLQAGRLRMWSLDVGDRSIAIIWCMRAFDTVAFYTTGFDSEWSAYGPGRHIMARAIQGAAAEGATEFDFLRGDEDYKRSWGVEMRHDLRIRRPASSRGRAVWLARSVVRRLRRSQPGGD